MVIVRGEKAPRGCTDDSLLGEHGTQLRDTRWEGGVGNKIIGTGVKLREHCSRMFIG